MPLAHQAYSIHQGKTTQADRICSNMTEFVKQCVDMACLQAAPYRHKREHVTFINIFHHSVNVRFVQQVLSSIWGKGAEVKYKRHAEAGKATRRSTSCLRGSNGSLSLMRNRHMEATRNSNSFTRGVSPPSGPTCTPHRTSTALIVTSGLALAHDNDCVHILWLYVDSFR